MIVAASFGAAAQSPSMRSLHSKAHKDQLANVKSRLDMTVISDRLKEDVARREAAVASEGSLSAEGLTLANDLIKEARTHLGKRYRAGSKGPSTFDCSGFSSYVYRQFGYSLSSSSKAQYTQGRPVERKKLQTGDLVFFTSRRSGSSVGHVGIVVSADPQTGDFKFIHAARTGIKVDDCKGYYEGRYLGARRIIE